MNLLCGKSVALHLLCRNSRLYANKAWSLTITPDGSGDGEKLARIDVKKRKGNSIFSFRTSEDERRSVSAPPGNVRRQLFC